jgi:thioesterase domain-containing protein
MVARRTTAGSVRSVDLGPDEIDVRTGDLSDPVTPGDPPSDELGVDPLVAWVTGLAGEALGSVPVEPDEDLLDLGLTSVSAAALLGRVQREAGVRLSNGVLFRAPTAVGLAAFVRDALERDRFSSLVAVHPGGSRTPFFCVHGGAGTVLHLRPLSRALGPDQPFYALQAPGLLGHGYPLADVAAMARRYVEEVRAVQPTGPYVLGGYCFGSIVAWEMVHQLRAAGHEVALLAVFNGPTAELLQRRVRTRRADDEPAAPPARLRRRAALLYMDGRRRATELRRDADIHLARLRGRPLEPDFLRRFYKSRCRHLEQHGRTRPGTGPVVVFRGAGLYEDPTLGWRDHVDDVAVHEIGGEHRNQRSLMAEPHASTVAPVLAREIDRALARAASDRATSDRATSDRPTPERVPPELSAR